MPVIQSLRAWWPWRTLSPEGVEFAGLALEILDAASRQDESWTFATQQTSDYVALANRASSRRWELLTLARQLQKVPAPQEMARDARRCTEALEAAAEAYQRLSSGYRFTKFERVCEGHEMLEQSRRHREQLALHLARRTSRSTT